MNNLHEKCTGCERIVDNKCAAYSSPAYWWDKRGSCPLATHTKITAVDIKKVNPLKASKRASKK